MSIFSSSAPALQGPTSVGSSATQIFNTTGTPIGSPAAPTLFTAGANLATITIVNAGLVTCFVGSSSVTATTGLVLRAGEQLTIQNGTHIVGESAWNLYAITASGTTTVEVGLGTFPSVV